MTLHVHMHMKQISGITLSWRVWPVLTFNDSTQQRQQQQPEQQFKPEHTLYNRSDRCEIPVDAAAAMWCINPLKIYPDLSPLFIIWLNSAVNLRMSSGQRHSSRMKTLSMHEVDSYFYLPASTGLMHYSSMIGKYSYTYLPDISWSCAKGGVTLILRKWTK